MRTLHVQDDEEFGSAGSRRYLAPFLLGLLCLAWILPGLVGHDPWKPDEAYSFGLVNHILKSGDWVVPTLAGEPFMEKPPLYYLTAAAFARVFSPALPLHDAARLASAFYMALALGFAGLAGRELFGKGCGWTTALVLIGSLGLLVRSHQMVTDVALFAGFAVALYGLALSLRRGVPGGLWLGTGVGIGFMSKGLLEPGVIGIVALLLPALSKPWRSRNYAVSLLVAAAAVLPWLTLWPWALYQRSPQLFMDWLWTNNFGRFLGFSGLGPGGESAFYLKILPWYAWPALPLALWTLWRGKLAALRTPEIQLPVTAFLATLAVLSFASDARDLYAMPLLLPLAMLAATGVETLRRGAVSALYWFGATGFMFFAAAIWFYWVALEFGMPARLSAHLNEMQPGYTPGFNGLVFGVALAYTLAWLIAVARLKRSKQRPIIVWAAGMTMVWGLLMTLFVSWVDTGKSYRSMIASLSQALPAHYGCLASQRLGEPQRALLEYNAGILTRRVELTGTPACELLLVQGSATDQNVSPGKDWRQIWDGARPGDNSERFRLFQRIEK